jgi:hypothetical protein
MNPNHSESCCGHGRWRHAACHVAGAIAMGVVFVTVFSWAVKLLWNNLMPGLFGLHPLTYWQAFGLLLLARMMFGGIHRGHRGHRHHRRGRRWPRDWHGRCGCGKKPAENPQQPEAMP